MKITVEEISTRLLSVFRTAQYNESTLRNYRYTLKFLEKHATEQNRQHYTPSLGESFRKQTANPRTGEFSVQRFKMRSRCVLLLNQFYETGQFDLSVKTRGLLMPDNPILRTAHQAYLAALHSEFNNDNTIHFFRYMNCSFLQYLDEVSAADIVAIDCTHVISYLTRTQHNLQRAALCGLRHYFRYLQRNDLLDAIVGISGIRKKTIIPTLTEDELSHLWATLEQSTVSYRNKAIILLCLTSGIRACDLVQLMLQDINWQTEIISFIQSKTGNAVMLPILSAVGNAIANYLMHERPKAESDILFIRQLA